VGLPDAVGVALAVAPGVGLAVLPGVGLAVLPGVGLAVLPGVGVTGGRVGATIVGGAGSAWTAEPALIALPTRAMTTPIATIAAISTASRLTQYRSRGSGPTGCRTLLITGRLSSAGAPSRKARRARVNITNRYVRPVPNAVVTRVITWYDANARDLPWRRPGTSPWAVLVSELMLQQTPVERVREPWARWLERWPAPSDLAASPSGDAVRAWGRLGYPRRALRLHGAAVAITERFDGQVPSGLDDLRSLPGVGAYTAAAVASFAFGRRAVVLDTNVRRVLGRLAVGEAYPGTTPTRAEIAVAEAFLPDEPARAARWAVASMELGALVCTARAPRCDACPVTEECAWRRAGYPAWTGPPRRGQTYEGTDRQCRGALLAVLRSSDDAVGADELATAWPEPVQRERALASLVADGLVVVIGPRGGDDPRWSLPG
jgi:A/G-specific adenine glycosylase